MFWCWILFNDSIQAKSTEFHGPKGRETDKCALSPFVSPGRPVFDELSLEIWKVTRSKKGVLVLKNQHAFFGRSLNQILRIRTGQKWIRSEARITS